MRDAPISSGSEVDGGETLGATLPGDDDAPSSAAGADDPPGASQVGQLGKIAPRIGRYAILRKLGQGGMGVVYAGYDELLDRKVAIKLLRHRTGASASARLTREAQALAKLSHPNVVQVYETGDHEGSAYIAMEFVEGQTLGAWRRGGPRPWSAHLQVMLDAGRGLAAAHEKGLVHRDFKPENVMIDSAGRVRVMDFGLVHGALASGPDPGEAPDSDLEPELDGDPHPDPEPDPHPDPEPDSDPDPSPSARETHTTRSRESLSVRLTLTGSTIGTPAYMSPEQHAGRPTDARSDQFSFCVAAWELLYGQRPFTGTNVAQLYFAVSNHQLREPPREAEVPSWIRKTLERGLAVDPGERFADMDELLAALSDDPRRRRGFLLGIAGVMVLALGGFGLRAVQLERAQAQVITTCADEAAGLDPSWNDEARASLAAAFDDSGQALARESWTQTEAALTRYATRWSELRGQSCRESRIEGTRSEASRVQVAACLDAAQVAFEVSLEVLADPNAELVAHASRLPQTLPRLDSCLDPSALARRAATETQTQDIAALRAKLQRAAVLELAADYDGAKPLLETVASEAETRGLASLEAEARLALGHLHTILAEYEAAEATLEASFVLAGAAASDELALRAAIQLGGLVASTLGEPERGRVWLRVADMLAARLGDANLDAAHLELTWAWIEREAANYELAMTHAQAALDLTRAALGPEHPELSAALLEIAAIHSARDEFDAALDLCEQALALCEDAYGPSHPEVAMILGRIAGVHGARGDFETARTFEQKALERRKAALGPTHPATASSLASLGVFELHQGRNAEAAALFEETLAIREAAYGPNSSHLAPSLTNLAIAQDRLGEPELAIESMRRGLAIFEATVGPEHPNFVANLANLSQFLIEVGALDEAEAAASRALALTEARFGPAHTKVAIAIAARAEVMEARGDLRGALAEYQRSRAIMERVLGPESYALSDWDFMIAYAHQSLGEFTEARAAYEHALALELAASSGGTRTAETRVGIVGTCIDLRDYDCAAEQLAAARADVADLDELPPELSADLETFSQALAAARPG